MRFDPRPTSNLFPQTPYALLRRHIPLFGLIGTLSVFGCQTDAPAETTKAAKKSSAPKRPSTPVAVAEPTRGSIASFHTTTCTLEAEKTAAIEARATGIIRRIAFEEGDDVRAGQVLLEIENDEYGLRVNELAAQTARLRERFLRLEGMVAKKLIGFEELEEAKYDLKVAEATEGQARLQLSYTKVRAPFSGRLVARMVDVGQTVKNETILFELADFEPLLARVFVPAKTFRRVARDQPVELTLDSNGIRLAGTIKLVSPVIDPKSGTIKVTVEVSEYPEDTRPGDFAEVRIVTERRDNTLLIPRIAIVENQKERVVFLVRDGKAHRRVVNVGFEEKGFIEVLDGVQPGDQVVIKGQNTLKDQAIIQVLDNAGA